MCAGNSVTNDLSCWSRFHEHTMECDFFLLIFFFFFFFCAAVNLIPWKKTYIFPWVGCSFYLVCLFVWLVFSGVRKGDSGIIGIALSIISFHKSTTTSLKDLKHIIRTVLFLNVTAFTKPLENQQKFFWNSNWCRRNWGMMINVEMRITGIFQQVNELQSVENI